MTNDTKYALEASLKKFLLKKPIDKITIRDLTDDCGISRMAFYYHFKDIYDLVEWSCFEDASRALAGKKTYDTWQEGLLQIFEAVLENKPFILNVYRALSREQIENYLFRLVYDLIMGVVEEKAAGLRVTQPSGMTSGRSPLVRGMKNAVMYGIIVGTQTALCSAISSICSVGTPRWYSHSSVISLPVQSFIGFLM